MRVVSPFLSLDGKENGIMAAVMRFSWLTSRKSLMRTNGNMIVENHGFSYKESHSGLTANINKCL
jgi:hypothetical protein